MSDLMCLYCLSKDLELYESSCKHALCLNCTLPFRANQSAESEIKLTRCPVCPQLFFHKDIIVNKITTDTNCMEGEKKSAKDCNENEHSDNAPCDTCSEVASTKYCTKCENHFCSDCLVHHKKVKALQFHELIDVPSLRYSEVKNEVKCRICATHCQNMDMYCVDCDEYICLKCLIFKHKQHDILDLETKIKKEKMNLEFFFSHLKSTLATYHYNLQNLKLNKKTDKDNIVNEIQKRGEIVKSEIDKKVQELLETVNQEYERYDKNCKKYVESKTKEKETMENSATNLETRIKNLNVETIVKSKNIMQPNVPIWIPFTDQIQIDFILPKNSAGTDFDKCLGYLKNKRPTSNGDFPFPNFQFSNDLKSLEIPSKTDFKSSFGAKNSVDGDKPKDEKSGGSTVARRAFACPQKLQNQSLQQFKLDG